MDARIWAGLSRLRTGRPVAAGVVAACAIVGLVGFEGGSPRELWHRPSTGGMGWEVRRGQGFLMEAQLAADGAMIGTRGVLFIDPANGTEGMVGWLDHPEARVRLSDVSGRGPDALLASCASQGISHIVIRDIVRPGVFIQRGGVRGLQATWAAFSAQYLDPVAVLGQATVYRVRYGAPAVGPVPARQRRERVKVALGAPAAAPWGGGQG